jgi:hypothetical protein
MAAAEQDERIPGFEEAFGEAAGDTGPTTPYATTQRLARGLGGEKAAVEALAAQGHQVIWYKPNILETNQGGVDAVTMKDGVVYLLDNKSYNTERNISSVSALTTNFDLDRVKLNLNKVLNQKDLNPEQDQVIHAALDALDRGDYVKAVTNANIFSRSGEVPQDVTDRLEQEHGIQFINLMPKSPAVTSASEARSEAAPGRSEPAADRLPTQEPAADRLPTQEPAADRASVEESPASDRLPTQEPASDRLPTQEPAADRASVEESPASYQPSEQAVYNEPSSVSGETTYHEPSYSRDSGSSYQPSFASAETSYRDPAHTYDPVSGSYQPSYTPEEESATHDESSLSSENDSASSYTEDHSGSGESDTQESDYEEPSYEETSDEDTSHESEPVEEDHSSFDEEDR